MKNVRQAVRSTGLASAILSVVLISPAPAADLGQGLKDGPVAPSLGWRGPYVGGHFGGVYDSGDDDLGAGVSTDIDDSAFLLGVHGGMSWQSGNYVYGIEADIGTSDDIEYLWSVRGRLGYGTDKWLAYFTGGVAFANFQTTVTGPNFIVDLDDDDPDAGYVLGGGIEFKVGELASIGLEGLYYDFEDDSNQALGFDLDNEFVVVRGRVTWHIGAGSGGRGAKRNY